MGLIKREQIAVMNQHYQKYSLDYFLDAQQRIGFQNIELWCGAGHFWLDSCSFGDLKTLEKKLARRNLKVVSLTCPSFSYQYQYAPLGKEARAKCLGYFSKGLEAAEFLGCQIMTVNSGWGCLDVPRDRSWQASKEMLQQLAEQAEAKNLVLTLESLRPDESNLVNSLEMAKKMWEEISHPALKLMVDTIASGAAGETLQDWFDVFGKDCIHMHFADGDPYVHNIWGDGNYFLCDMLDCLSRNGYKGYLVQEIADERYFDQPDLADAKNYQILSRFFE